MKLGQLQNIGGDAEILFEQIGGGDDLPQNGAWNLGAAPLKVFTPSPEHMPRRMLLLGASRASPGACSSLHKGDVVVDVFLLLHHSA